MSLRYLPRYTCTACGHRWKGKSVSALQGRSAEEDALYRIQMHGTPPCPNCAAEQERRGIDLSLNKAPAQVGQNIGVKAIDETAKIVMEDYGMGDLRTDVRPGETAAPKLPPAQQFQADNFFGAPGQRRVMAARDPQTGRMVPMRSNPTTIGRAAVAGAYRQSNDLTVGSLSEKNRPPVRVVAGDRR